MNNTRQSKPKSKEETKERVVQFCIKNSISIKNFCTLTIQSIYESGIKEEDLPILEALLELSENIPNKGK